MEPCRSSDRSPNVDREPWYIAAGQPGKADATMVFLDLRYVPP
jgi:hypothetical protein